MKFRFFCVPFVIVALLPSDDVWAESGPKKKLDPPHAERTPVTYRGGLVNPPLPKPRFTLTDTSGVPFDFWSKTQGYVTFLFFGYTYCPDQCPLHMQNVAMALKEMSRGRTDQIKLVFVTTDPARDNPKVLRSWLDHFDKRFIGLTGSEAAIEAAQRAAGVPPARKTTTLANGDYAVGHANFILAYTKDNLAHLIYPGGIAQQDWAHDIPQLLNEEWRAGGHSPVLR
jgi:protein SCO1/2